MLVFKLLKEGKIEQLYLQLRQHDIEEKDDCGNTLLHRAVESGDILLSIKLIDEYKANINAQDRFNHTCLIKAILNNDIKMIDMLLSKNALVNLATDTGLTPIHLAIQLSNFEAVLLLYDKYDHIPPHPSAGNLIHSVIDSLDSKGFNEKLFRFVMDKISKTDLKTQKDRFGNTALESFRDKGEFYLYKYKKVLASHKTKFITEKSETNPLNKKIKVENKNMKS